MKRRIVRALIWTGTALLSLIVVVVAAAWIYSQTESFRSLVREHALSAVRESVNGEVTFASLTGSIWRTVQVHGLSVRQNGQEVLSAKTVTIKLSLIRQALAFLYSSRLHVAQIDITDPVVLAVENSQREWNLASLVKKKKPDEPEQRKISIFLDRVKIAGGRIDARFYDGRAARFDTVAFDANAALLPAGVKADVAVLDFLFSSKGFPDVRWQSALAFDGSSSSPAVDVRRLALRTPKSQIEASGSVKDFSRPVTNLTVEIKKLAAEELKAFLPSLPLREDLSGALSAQGPRSALKIVASVAAADGKLRGTATADWSRAEPQLRGEIEAERFAVDKVFDTGESGGTLSGRGSFTAAGMENIQASTQAQVSEFKLQGWQMGLVNISGNLKNKKLALTADSRGKQGQMQLQAAVELLNPLIYEFTLKARDLDLQKTAADKAAVPVAARISADMSVKGRETDPKKAQADVRINILPSRVGEVALAKGEATGKLRDGVLSLETVRLDSKEATLTARGRIALVESTAANQLTYTLRAKEIRPWLALAGMQGSGSVNLDGTAAGSIKNPRLEGKAQIANLAVAGKSFQSGNLAWTLVDISGPKLSGQIKASATGADVGVVLRTLTLNLGLQGKEPVVAQIELAGEDLEQHHHRIKAQARYFSDRLESLIQEMSFQLATGVWRNGKPVNVVLRGRTATIDDLVLQRGAQNIRTQGTVGLQGNQDFNVQLNQVPVEEFQAFLPASRDVSGQMTGEIKVRGSAASPLLDGRLRVDRLTVSKQPYAGLEGTASYSERRLQLNFQLRQDNVHSLSATGQLPIDISWGGNRAASAPGEADLRLYSQGLSVAFIGALTKDVEKVQGNVTMDIRLRGPVQGLVPSGQLQLARAQARIPALGVDLSEVDLQAAFAAGKISVTRLSARSGDGRLTGNGQLGVAGYKLQNVNLALEAENFQVMNTREFKGGVNGKLTMAGSLEKPFVRGDLTLVQTRLQPDIARYKKKGPPPRDPTIMVIKSDQDLSASRQQPAQTKPAATEPAPSPFFQRLGLELVAHVPRGTWVYLDEGQVELSGTVRIRKQPGAELALSGALRSVRGWYTFQGRKFQLERGEVVFTGGGQSIEPRLDIEARYKTSDYEVYLVIGGTTKEPTLNLRSEPPLEQADILSVLVFGKPAGELTQGQQNLLQAQALQATAEFVAGGLRQSVARKLGVDSLEFSLGSGSEPGKVGVGKYVHEDVYVSASQQIGGEKAQEYSLEYQITPRWQLKGSTESGKNSGIDLFWHKRY